MRKILFVLSIMLLFSTTSCKHLWKSYDDAVINYEEYQAIYNTCAQINLDLCNIREIPDTNAMFKQFGKEQRIQSLQAKMNRWTEEYNAKSKMVLRSVWKSPKLPYELKSTDFSCYNN